MKEVAHVVAMLAQIIRVSDHLPFVLSMSGTSSAISTQEKLGNSAPYKQSILGSGSLVIISVLLVLLLAFMVVIVLLTQRLRQFQSLHQSQPMYLTSEHQREEVDLRDGALEADIPSPVIDASPDNPLYNKRWVTLVEECVDLYDELDRHFVNFDPPRQELADHVLLRLQEVLVRSGVELINDDTVFDVHRHKPEQAGTSGATGESIAETLSPGFTIGQRVLRLARVRLTEVLR